VVTETDIATNVTSIALTSAQISGCRNTPYPIPSRRRECINSAIAHALTSRDGLITFHVHVQTQELDNAAPFHAGRLSTGARYVRHDRHHR
jgi:hypothetical protein